MFLLQFMSTKLFYFISLKILQNVRGHILKPLMINTLFSNLYNTSKAEEIQISEIIKFTAHII